jgi:hypothetical protein
MKIMKKITFFVAAIILLHLNLNAQSSGKRFKLQGEKNVKISLKNSNIKIVGYNGYDVVITATKSGADATTKNDLNIVNANNSLTINKIGEDEYNYIIKVPSQTNISLAEEFRAAKSLEIKNVAGKVEVNSWVSKIVLKDVSGPVVAISKSADIWVDFSSINKAPSSIESSGRLVEVTVPSSAKFNLRLNAMSGKVISDFDLGAANKGALLKLGSVREINSQVNGGGTELHIQGTEIRLHRKN